MGTLEESLDSVNYKLNKFLQNGGIKYTDGFFKNITVLKGLKKTIELNIPSMYDLEVIKFLALLDTYYNEKTIIESKLLELRDEIIEMYSKRKLT